MAGFEPANDGVKVRCLTPWRHPNIRLTTKHAKEPSACLKLKMGWIVGFEPTVSSATNWRFNRLSYTHHILARLKGLEPLTHCLEGSCSIHLSYRRTLTPHAVCAAAKGAGMLTQTSSRLAGRPRGPIAARCGAGDGNRTHVASLEGWNSTIELHPHSITHCILSHHRGSCQALSQGFLPF